MSDVPQGNWVPTVFHGQSFGLHCTSYWSAPAAGCHAISGWP